MELSAERLRSLLAYDPLTGSFQWRHTGRGRSIGEAGFLDSKGYRRICIDGREYKAHRLAWLYVNEVWPRNVIDHRNRIRADNRIDNLRDVSVAENTQNTTPKRGVYRLHGKWRAEIKAHGKRKHLGYFVDQSAAEHAYKEAKMQLHAEA